MSISNARMERVVALDGRRLSLRWSDGLEGVADFSETLRHPAYAALRDPKRFAAVGIAEDGWTIFWIGSDGEEIDVCPDVLRAMVDPAAAARIAEEERRWRANRPAAE